MQIYPPTPSPPPPKKKESAIALHLIVWWPGCLSYLLESQFVTNSGLSSPLPSAAFPRVNLYFDLQSCASIGVRHHTFAEPLARDLGPLSHGALCIADCRCHSLWLRHDFAFSVFSRVPPNHYSHPPTPTPSDPVRPRQPHIRVIRKLQGDHNRDLCRAQMVTC